MITSTNTHAYFFLLWKRTHTHLEKCDKQTVDDFHGDDLWSDGKSSIIVNLIKVLKDLIIKDAVPVQNEENRCKAKCISFVTCLQEYTQNYSLLEG